MTSQYTLRSHVFACCDGGQVVLLDVKADRYLALKALPPRAFDPRVSGWPRSAGIDESLIQTLLGKGLLAVNASQPRSCEPIAVSSASREIFCDQYDDRPRRPTRTVLAFIAATVFATAAIRLWPFERLVRHVSRRNEVQRSMHKAAAAERLQAIIHTFVDLRPFLFSWRDACLFESFVLSEFLARHGIYPTWMFGVQARPLAAHCWLQLDDIVVNDTIERVSTYMPIMAV